MQLVHERIAVPGAYPFSIPAIGAIDGLVLHPRVTYFVGENGSGKSTLLEGLAVAAGFNPEGGSMNFRFSTRSSESSLAGALRLVRSVRRPRTGFFLRAESFFNLATTIEMLDKDPMGPPIIGSYGGRSLHEQSHGESFMALALHRFGPQGLYVLDEPEAALSPLRQMSTLRRMHDLAQQMHLREVRLFPRGRECARRSARWTFPNCRSSRREGCTALASRGVGSRHVGDPEAGG